jgi:uncharacterized membrane protein
MHHAGHFVTEGTLLACAWLESLEAKRRFRTALAEVTPLAPAVFLKKLINDGVRIDVLRGGGIEDLSISVRQLTDIAIKALSPAVNDPESTINAIDALSCVFVDFCARHIEPIVSYDARGLPRVYYPVAGFVHLLGVCCDQIRAYGAKDITVVRRSLHFLGDIGTLCVRHRTPQRLALVRLQIAQWKETVVLSFGEKSVEAQWLARSFECKCALVCSLTCVFAYFSLAMQFAVLLIMFLISFIT